MRVAQEQLSQRRFYFRYFRADAKSRKWGMSVTTCGKSIILPEDGSYPPRQHPPHYHFDWEHGRALNEYQIVYIPEGYGLFETKNQKIKIRGDNVILLRPGLWHRYRPKPETGWREYWVGFAGPAYKKIFDAHVFPDKSVFRVRESAGMHETFEALITCAQENGAALQQLSLIHISSSKPISIRFLRYMSTMRCCASPMAWRRGLARSLPHLSGSFRGARLRVRNRHRPRFRSCAW